MPFGLRNAPKFFNNVISELSNHLIKVIVFVDDILIYNVDEKSHIDSMKTVLDILGKNNVAINLKKSIFYVPNINYLRFVIDRNGYSPDLERLKNYTK